MGSTGQEMSEALVAVEEIRAAAERISSIAVQTPLIEAEFPGVSGHGAPRRIWLKAESLQPIGAFKLRGASNKILQLTAEEVRRGVITYSSGNHAQGVAYAARALGVKAVIVMPENAPEVKRRATEALGAEIVSVGPASAERKQKAEALAAEFGYVVVPPYDDARIVAGQGTAGLEIMEELPDVDVVLAPVSGGGLLSGVAVAVRGMKPSARVIGVEPELAGDAAESFRRGELVTWPAEKTTRTICDGLRTQSLGELNFAHIRALVDAIVTVSEEEISEAMRVLGEAGIKAEPSGAVTTAAVLFHELKLRPYRRLAAVSSGSNYLP